MRRSILLALVVLVLCAPPALAAPPPAETSGNVCSVRKFEGNRFTVCDFDSHTAELQIAVTGRDGAALRSFARLAASLGPRARKVLFAMNAGMFGTNGAPIGLYIENGRLRHRLNTRDGSGNFYLTPNGVFSLDAHGRVRIDTTEQFAAKKPAVLWASQSGPMLLTDGGRNPHISPDGPSKNIRNGVGVLDSRRAAFVISEEPVSFGQFERFFADVLQCRDALYFDGVVSSAWIPAEDRRDDRAPLGPTIVVLKRN
ncbi:MAG: phosphodiester glycosidase family protein [Alphaproteobacteria bacterium]|nr:phosphodiester glycosidase family protein [Alphaproteobacteria bacterium]